MPATSQVALKTGQGLILGKTVPVSIMVNFSKDLCTINRAKYKRKGVYDTMVNSYLVKDKVKARFRQTMELCQADLKMTK